MNRKYLWIGPQPVPANVSRALGSHWSAAPYQPLEPLGPQLRSASLALIYPNGSSGDTRMFGKMLYELEHSSTVAVFMLPSGSHGQKAWRLLSRRRGQFVCVDQDAGAEELTARLATVAQLQPAIQNLRGELAAHSEGSGLAITFDELNEEMRLAARLQRDFLPRRLPEVGQARFGAIYRPLSWVSGDIYDVVRLDESHVGFYVADAVGHGMPAALLTMFIKKALQTKRIVGSTYEIVPPHVSLSELNSDMCRQSLSSCQFCTAVYCVLDAANLTLTYARAGHPEPVLLRADGSTVKLEVPGSLLGIFPDEEYQSRQVQLRPGDRLILYSDGAECPLRGSPEQSDEQIESAMAPLAGIGRDDFMMQLTSNIDQHHSAPHQDDVTVVVMDILDNCRFAADD